MTITSHDDPGLIHQYIDGNFSEQIDGLDVYLHSEADLPFTASQLSALLTDNQKVTKSGLFLVGGGPNKTEQAVFNCMEGDPVDASLDTQPLAGIRALTLVSCNVTLRSHKGTLPLRSIEATANSSLVLSSVVSPLLAESKLRDSVVMIVDSSNATITTIDMQDSVIAVDDRQPSVLISLSGVTVHDTTTLPQNYRASLTLLSGTSGVTVENSHFLDNHVMPVLIHALASVKINNCHFLSNVVDGRSYEESYETGTLSAGLGIRIPSDSSAKVIQITNCTVHNNTLLANNNTLAASGAGLQVVFANHTSGLNGIVAACTFTNNSLLNVYDNPWAKHDHVNAGVMPSPTFHGGGASFLFLEKADWNILQILNCDFGSNRAVRGGGLAVEFWGASNNSVTIAGNDTACLFTENLGTHADATEEPLKKRDFQGIGGGLYVSLEVTKNSSCERNVINVSGCTFESNGAAEGGGMYVGVCDVTALNQVYITNSSFRLNTAISGSGLSMWSCYMFAPTSAYSERKLVIKDVHFDANKAFFRGAMAVTTLEFHTEGLVTFEQNINTAMFLRMSIQHCRGHLHFHGNVGQAGAGLFSSGSKVIVYPDSSAHFTNNTALWSGGGMYVESGVR